MEKLDAFGNSDREAEFETPFGLMEAVEESETSTIAMSAGLTPWEDDSTSLADESLVQSEAEADFEDLFEELRDEAFDEAVSHLADETQLAVAGQFASESASNFAERERLADRHLDGVRYEAEDYLEKLEEGVTGVDIASYSDEQLTQFLDSFDRQPADLTPASENFFRKLVRKAKKGIKWVAKKAKKAAKSTLLRPILARLKRLVRPLLKRVLSFAIGRLPASLRPLARKLSKRFNLEAGSGDYSAHEPLRYEGPSVLTLAREFDAAIADGIMDSGDPDGLGAFGEEEAETLYGPNSHSLETLEGARGELLERLRNAEDGQDLTPEIEQFAPAILGAMRVGIRLIGRRKVVAFLAKLVAKLIKRWVGPQMARPLSNSIVDAGLKMVSLEAEGESGSSEADISADALAGVIEDTVRRFAENEDYIFEDESLSEVAAHEAFSAAAATHFPASFIKPHLRQAPKLGGTFIRRRIRSLRPHARYTRSPDVVISEQMADALPAFGDPSLGSVMRNSGVRFPAKARVHIFQALAGSSPAQILNENSVHTGVLGRSALQPLSEGAAGMLLGEPALGTRYLASQLRHSSEAEPGQRMYLLEMLDQAGGAHPLVLGEFESARSRRGSRFRQRIDRRRRAVILSWYISESRAQHIAGQLRQGMGAAVVLRMMMAMMARARLQGEAAAMDDEPEVPFEGLEEEAFSLGDLGGVFRGLKNQLARQVRRWTGPMIARWLRKNIPAFLRAVDDPRQGISIQIILTGVPGLSLVLDPLSAAMKIGQMRHPFAGKPEFKVRLVPGYRR
ncbi:MAG: hypothetical protein QNJ15_13240 [Erythrobacter sp.]|nr:hypothetical protein [Erythrobacter sp.]